MHIVEHLFHTILPNLLVSAVAEETYGYDNIALKAETLLRFDKLVFETCAATESYDFVSAYHDIAVIYTGFWFL